MIDEMRNYKKSFSTKICSFTLVEVVVVMGIIGVLMSIVYGGIDSLLMMTRRSKAASNLRQIALAYRQYMQDMGTPIRWADVVSVSNSSNFDLSAVAALLAKYGYLNSPEIWAWDFDYRVKQYLRTGASFPEVIYDKNTAKVSHEFGGRWNGVGFPLSVCGLIAVDHCTAEVFLRNQNDVPVAFSRGLREGTTSPGTWADRSVKNDLGGIFGNKGGLIAFLDGRVEWCEDLGTGDTAKLKKYGTDEVTNKFFEALPSGGNHNVYVESYSLSWYGGGPDCSNF